MSPLCHEALSRLKLPNVEIISLLEFEHGDDKLKEAKANRSMVEYYFTCTPSLPVYIFKHFPDVDLITYIDADFFFFSDPSSVMEKIGSHPIAITGHRFPEKYKYLEQNFGIYNVGWLTFRRDDQALSCLQRWREQCIEWCYDRLENGRFADQMYLNDWPENYPDTLIISHKGVNLSPCNIANHRISFKSGRVQVDDEYLVCYHFFGLKNFRSIIYYLSLTRYGANPTVTILDHIYEPYLKALVVAEQQASEVLKDAVKTNSLREITQTSLLKRQISWFEPLVKKYVRYKAVFDALIYRRFILFFNGRIIFKFIPGRMGSVKYNDKN